ncbi:MAG: iron ABC transporter permease [Planctomycetaceae bacterium]|jgi:iron complex transport system permease protein|nr:iron ABC transporter permease [Planctomycetaceae bacterium]
MNLPSVSDEYHQYFRRKYILFAGMVVLLPVAFFLSIAIGPVKISLAEVVRILLGCEAPETHVRIVYHFRLPQALAAVFAGAGLAISGATMQAVLRNPLCSPFTLGISGAAAFGAALVIFLNGGAFTATAAITTTSTASWFFGSVTAGAFLSSCLATGLILTLSVKRSVKSETIILIGVALGAFYGAGTMMLQYFATERQLAAMVYWTFGDTQRATWHSVKIMSLSVVVSVIYFISQSWNYNALVLGEENARALGVPVRRIRLGTMFFASLLTSVLVTSLGIIGFVGLVIPHGVRLWVGSDNRFVLPCSTVCGALLLLVADTIARSITPGCVMPVSILTAFLGAPLFLLMLLNRKEV